MRNYSAIITYLFLTVGSYYEVECINLLRGGDGDNDNDVEQQQQQQQNNQKRYFVQYTDRIGRRLVRRCARKIITDEDSTDYTVFEGDSRCFGILRNHSAIITIEEDHPVYAFGNDASSPNHHHHYYRRLLSPYKNRDLGETIPWGIQAIQATELSPGPNNVTICVVDTGIAIGHPEFDGVRISGMDRPDKADWKWDEDRAGHGTHVSGIIAAIEGNDYGVAGAGMFDLFIVRALSDDKTGYESDIYKAVQLCIMAEADVINMSLGSPTMSNFVRDSYRKAFEDLNIILVAAAGNNGDNTKNYPASYGSVISVSAVDENGKKLPISVSNDQIELVAPGDNILSTSVATHAVRTDSLAFTANRVVGTPNEAVTGPLSLNDDVESGGICLFDLGRTTEEGSDVQALESCAAEGGKGAIFYNSNNQATEISNLYIPNGQIPAVCISKTSAISLLDQLTEVDYGNFNVTIGDEGNDNVEYTFDWKSGSSMASPHVSASAALLKSHFVDCTASQIRYALAINAEYPGDSKDKCDEDYGYGMVKVKDSYDWLVEKGGCSGWDVETISQGGCTTIP